MFQTEGLREEGNGWTKRKVNGRNTGEQSGQAGYHRKETGTRPKMPSVAPSLFKNSKHLNKCHLNKPHRNKLPKYTIIKEVCGYVLKMQEKTVKNNLCRVWIDLLFVYTILLKKLNCLVDLSTKVHVPKVTVADEIWPHLWKAHTSSGTALTPAGCIAYGDEIVKQLEGGDACRRGICSHSMVSRQNELSHTLSTQQLMLPPPQLLKILHQLGFCSRSMSGISDGFLWS